MSFTVNFFCDFMAKDFTPSVIDKDLKQIINSAKFNVINFEAPIHSPSKPILKSGSSHSQWEYGPRWLEDNGFNVILLANNHIMDYGADGLLKTINAFVIVLIIFAVFSFSAMTVISSMGLLMFWGWFVTILGNLILTVPMLCIANKK